MLIKKGILKLTQTKDIDDTEGSLLLVRISQIAKVSENYNGGSIIKMIQGDHSFVLQTVDEVEDMISGSIPCIKTS